MQAAAGGGTADRRAARVAARDETRRLAEAAQRLSGLANSRLRDDLRPWGSKLALWTAVLASALDVLDLAVDDPRASGLAAARREVAERLAEVRRRPSRMGDDQFDRLVRTCLEQAGALSA
jgi:hypothetical protein